MSSNVQNAQLGRFSSQQLEQLGVQRVVRTVTDQRANTFTNGNGAAKFISPTAIRLAYTGLQPGSVNGDLYSAVFAYFESRSGSKSAAQTMAILLIDAASFENKSAIEIIERAKTAKVDLANELVKYVNLLRTPSDQHEKSQPIRNSASNRSRSILP